MRMRKRSGRLTMVFAAAISVGMVLASCGSSGDSANDATTPVDTSSSTDASNGTDDTDVDADDADTGSGDDAHEDSTDDSTDTSADEDTPPSVDVEGLEPEVSHLAIAVTPVPDFAPVYYALSEGIFEHYGFTAEVVAKGSQVIPALLADSYQVTSAATSVLINALDQGLDITFIAPGLRGEPDMQLGVYSMDDSITDEESLVGKTVAINQPKAVFELGTRTFMTETGHDPDSIDFQVLPLGSMVGALVAGQVDSAYLVPPFSTEALAQGAHLVVDGYKDNSLEGTPLAPIAVATKWAEDNPNAVTLIQQALREAADGLNNLSDDEYQDFIINTFDNLTPEVVGQMPRYHFWQTVDTDGLQKVADAMQQLDWIGDPITIADHTTN